MSKREFYDSIINFKANVDVNMLDEKKEDAKTMEPPPVYMP